MKQFVKFFFASCLGTVIGLGLLGLIGVGAISAIGSKAKKSSKVKPNTVLKMTLSAPIPEQTNNVSSSPYSFDLNQEDVLGLRDILETIKSAKDDDRIKGIYLELAQPQAGFSTLSAIRDGLEDFKESGKFIVAYQKVYSQSSYYVSSVADKVYMNPKGMVDFRGFAAQIPFYKDMLDRLGIKAQVFYAGKFKSATEPYRRTEMSESNRLQLREYLNGSHKLFLEEIGKSRNLEVAELMRISDGYLLRKPEDAVKYKIVDELYYKDQVLADLRNRLGLEDDDKIEATSLGKLRPNLKKKSNYKIKDKVAVVYAEGTIVLGAGNEPGKVDGDRYSKMLRKIRLDDKVKAVVLRVNSPGGSALASDMMWREINLMKEAGTPVVVSMGDYAASGGYYIAAPADKIFAEKNTLTGSIGVFGLLPSVEHFLDDKIGVAFDTVKTGKYATTGTIMYDMRDDEGAIIQESIDLFYSDFIGLVAEGRGMEVAAVDSVAQGRIWTGVQAKEKGLIDEFGNLQDAIDFAVAEASLDEYRLSEYPKTKAPLQQLMDKISSAPSSKAKAAFRQEMGPEVYQYFEYMQETRELSGIQARLPFMLTIK